MRRVWSSLLEASRESWRTRCIPTCNRETERRGESDAHWQAGKAPPRGEQPQWITENGPPGRRARRVWLAGQGKPGRRWSTLDPIRKSVPPSRGLGGWAGARRGRVRGRPLRGQCVQASTGAHHTAPQRPTAGTAGHLAGRGSRHRRHPIIRASGRAGLSTLFLSERLQPATRTAARSCVSFPRARRIGRKRETELL